MAIVGGVVLPLSRQALTTFGTATGQNQTTVFCGHTRTEAVTAGADNFRRLECTFHMGLTTLFMRNGAQNKFKMASLGGRFVRVKPYPHYNEQNPHIIMSKNHAYIYPFLYAPRAKHGFVNGLEVQS